jgi:hypothetical protein
MSFKGSEMKVPKVKMGRPKSIKETVKKVPNVSVKKPRKLASGGAVRTVKKRDGDTPVKIY